MLYVVTSVVETEEMEAAWTYFSCFSAWRCAFLLLRSIFDYQKGFFLRIIVRAPQIRYSGAECYSENIRGNSPYRYGLCASEQAWSTFEVFRAGIMRCFKTFSVRRCDKRSGFEDPVPNDSAPSFHFHNNGIFEVPHRGVASWLVAACHLSAQYERINSFEDYGLLVIRLIHCPEGRVCLG